jgi:hypothetical protein
MKQALNSLLSRRMLAACAAVAAVAGASLVGGTPAQARDYAYCLTSPGYGYPGDCSYASYGQCLAAASGRLADCNLNPRVGFREPRHRDYRTYGDTRW